MLITDEVAFARELGARLAAARNQRGLTQDEVAAAVGLSRLTIVRYESGQLAPRSHLLRKLATALGVQLEELVP